ncbi:potassium channel family protein [Conexibacter sp. SYSU D00693]|uniref:potassium channel family protein n=1 Tax=Conexibacter sp. SYSU D00693 TaxID=2812560 RepID=UPI00196AA757|nr:potassium channel family protein [Conexibacter sp. SYSU D00693]
MRDFFRQQPSATLLAAQLAGILLYPFMKDNDAGRALFSLFGILILGLVIRIVRSKPGVTHVALVVGTPAAVLLLIQAATRSSELLPYSSALEAILYFYVAGLLIAHLVGDPHVTRDDLFGIGATFTLLAWAFAYAFVVCQAIEPGSFIAATEGEHRTWIELLFLSVTTLTSTGLSDVVPVQPFARGLVMVEQLAGVGFVAVLVSRLVALTVVAREHEHHGR